MYKLHLILKYLRKRRIAWVSLIAVMLCTTMVLVVISVMGGWLRMFRESFHGISGDINITSRYLTGFEHYNEMIDKIEKLPEVEAAVPIIKTFGLMKVGNASPDAVQVLGYQIDRIGKVNNFPTSLYRQWQKPVDEEHKDPDKVPQPTFNLIPDKPYEIYSKAGAAGKNWPGMIVGAGVVGIGKDKDGKVSRNPLMYEIPVNLEVLRLKEDTQSLSQANATPRNYWIVDDSRTQIWQLDAKTVYVPFEILQKDLGMAKRVLDDGSEEPARTTDIQIKAKPGVNLYKLKPKIIDIVAECGYPIIKEDLDPPIAVETWEEVNKTWLGAVEKEKTLVTLLFGMISIVAIFLIFCIFYMIVVEKTKDIGIIKSVGATSSGVAGIFLGYGLTIGIIGAACGLALGYLIVHNINWLHDQMHHLTGAYVWDPEVYAFDTIPNTMNPHEVMVIVGVAIIASVLGALVPAIRAAQMNPVEALRWE